MRNTFYDLTQIWRYRNNLDIKFSLWWFHFDVEKKIRRVTRWESSHDRIIYDSINYSFGYLKWWNIVFFKAFLGNSLIVISIILKYVGKIIILNNIFIYIYYFWFNKNVWVLFFFEFFEFCFFEFFEFCHERAPVFLYNLNDKWEKLMSYRLD